LPSVVFQAGGGLLAAEFTAVSASSRSSQRGERRLNATFPSALRPLQKAGLVRSQRGQISILDGAGLEARSCERCFVVRDHYDRLLGVA
jgi:hypothetical protein